MTFNPEEREYHFGETEGVVNPISKHEGSQEKCPNCGEEMAFIDQGFRQYNRCKICGTETEAKTEEKTETVQSPGLSLKDEERWRQFTEGAENNPETPSISLDEMTVLKAAGVTSMKEFLDLPHNISGPILEQISMPKKNKHQEAT